MFGTALSSRSSRPKASRNRRNRRRRAPRCMANGHYRPDGRPTSRWLSAALRFNERIGFDADPMSRDD